ncbi:MAG: 3-ketoacyl-ACP reductase [Candidatus Hodarchaeota archaeon]
MDSKVALITGSGGGIGFAIGARLMEEKYVVIFNDLSSSLKDDKLAIVEELKEKHGTSYKYIQADISSDEGHDKIMSLLRNEVKRIDVLVNNAGIAPRNRRDLLEMEREDFKFLMSVNLEGPFFLTQKVANFMLDLINSKKFEDLDPYIINIASISSYTSSINRGEYCISKAGVTMMTKLFATRLANSISVHEIRPGIIQTSMTSGVLSKYEKLIDEGLLPIKRIGKPEDIANAVVGIVNGYFYYSTGNVFDVDGGFHIRRL